MKKGRRNLNFYQSCFSALLAFWKVPLLKEKSNSTYFVARLNSRIASYLPVSRSLQVIIGSVQLCSTALARMPKARELCVAGRASAPSSGGHWMKTISLERFGRFDQNSWHKICSPSPAVFFLLSALLFCFPHIGAWSCFYVMKRWFHSQPAALYWLLTAGRAAFCATNTAAATSDVWREAI